MGNDNKIFILVAIRGTHTQIVKQGVIKIVQAERTRLKKEIQWKAWKFQVRTPEGYKNIKILPDKKKK